MSVEISSIPQQQLSVPDKQLLRQMANGSRQALVELYQRHSGVLYNYILRFIRDPQSAEDVLQDVFLSAWQNSGSFRGKAQVKTWLFRIAHNRSISWLRQAKQEVALTDVQLSSQDESPENMSIFAWQASLVHSALEQLSPIHRSAIELSFVHGLSYQEIAHIMECPLGTVKSRINAALHHLFGILKKQGIDG